MQWIIIGIVVVLVLWVFATYNGLVTKRNRVDNSWGQIEVQTKRRYDLIPNLVETVKGYAAHEQQTFERVVQARSLAQSAKSPGEQAQAENMLTGALRQLFAVAEAYPELRASENFQGLQAELSDTENKIAVSRQIYNDAVLTFNNSVQVAPANLIAGHVRVQGPRVLRCPRGGRRAAQGRVLIRSPILSIRRRFLLAVLVGLAVVLPALPALAQEFSLPQADVEIVVEPDGSLLVTEHITYDFDGSFSGWISGDSASCR